MLFNRTALIPLLTGLLVFSSACGGGGGTVTPSGPTPQPSASKNPSGPPGNVVASASGIISANAGGEISLPDGSYVAIPAGVFSSDTNVSIYSLSSTSSRTINDQYQSDGPAIFVAFGASANSTG